MTTEFAMEEGGETMDQESKQNYWSKIIRISHRCLMVSSLVNCIIGVSLRSRYTFGLVVCYLAIWVGMLGLLIAGVTHIATYELEVIHCSANPHAYMRVFLSCADEEKHIFILHGMDGASSAVRLAASRLTIFWLSQNGEQESIFMNYAINSKVVSFLLVLFIGLAASIVSLRSIFEDYLQWHAGEHDEYATDVGYAEIAVTALALSIFTAVATETATLVAVSRMEKALISSLGDSNSTRRKAVVWNRDQAYLSLLLAFGLLGTVVVGRATLAMYYVDGAVGRKEVRVSCGIGIMLFVRTAKFVLVVFIVLSLESKISAMAGLTGFKLRFCGYALAATIPSAIAAASTSH
eukprot:jgi/Bigna1/83768/fgenesh1_pg.115_\